MTKVLRKATNNLLNTCLFILFSGLFTPGMMRTWSGYANAQVTSDTTTNVQTSLTCAAISKNDRN